MSWFFSDEFRYWHRSKLGSLFSADQAGARAGNESLTYTAPKEPKKAQPAKAESGAAPALLFACAVHAYKYVDNQYVKQGKLGAAILGNHSNSDYKILLYVSKDRPVTTAKVTRTFSFTVQANNYASFYDDQRQTWSIMFDSESNAVDFTKHIGMSRANSGAIDGIVHQDLVLGEGQTVDVGDSMEMKYTGWLLSNNTFGQVFDSNMSTDKAFRFKIGKGKVIKGWEDGTVGMKKSGKRLLVIPPHLAYGAKGVPNRVPAHATLVFEVHAMKVKFNKEDTRSTSSRDSPAPRVDSPVVEAQPPAQAAPQAAGEATSVKARTSSISEQLGHPSSSKAKLISRMAKMGQAIIPSTGDGEGDVEPELEEQPQVVKPVPQQAAPVQPVAQPPQQMAPPQQAPPQIQPGIQGFAPPGMPQQQVAMYQPQMQQQPFQYHVVPPYQYPQTSAPSATPYNYQQPGQAPPPQYNNMYPAQQQFPGQQFPGQQQQFPGQQQQFPGQQQQFPGQPGSDMHTNMLVSETRQQNTEMRIAIGKVTDKVEQILSKVDNLQLHGMGNSLVPQGPQGYMEASVLMQNIQRILQDNERLKKEVFEKSSRVESQNEKIAELLQRNQKFIEQSNTMLEQRNDTFKTTAAQSQARVLELEQEKVQMANELSITTAQLSRLQLEMAGLRKQEGDLTSQLNTAAQEAQKHLSELNTLRQAKTETDSQLSELQQTMKTEKVSKRQQDSRMGEMEDELTELRAEKEGLEKSGEGETLSERKTKATADRRKLEEEMDEIKRQHEEEVEDLRSKLRKHRASTDAVTAEQVAAVEQEIETQWKDKCDRLVAQTQDKHRRQMEELQEEKEQLKNKLSNMESKLAAVKNSQGEGNQKVEELEEKLEEMAEWKEKYTSLHGSALGMKERYEEQITELRDQLEQAQSSGAMTTPNIAQEVKKIMNQVFHSLRAEFEPEGSYTGKAILAAIVDAIKTTTVKLLSQQPSQQEEGRESGSEEESEEEEEEEEGEEEEEKQEEEEEVKEQQQEDSTEDAVQEEAVPVQAVESTEPPAQVTNEDTEEQNSSETSKTETPPVPDSATPPTVDDQGTEDSGSPSAPAEQAEDKEDSKEAEQPVDEVSKETVENKTDNDRTEQASEEAKSVDNNVTVEKKEEGEETVTMNQSDQTNHVQQESENVEKPPEKPAEEEKKPDVSNIFGDDDILDDGMADAFGVQPKDEEAEKEKTKQATLDDADDPFKPEPPPPLFPDDDDDDLDWLS
ncbi:FK506-binding protein 15-like isoform X3 [Branchiostoma lanceolatum]|uniref:FK506-binding protein 15-like isoform X3 n=1 Tax=Branchiostoma lanceolatum TaxID=7740 RepID=UPI0034556D7B